MRRFVPNILLLSLLYLPLLCAEEKVYISLDEAVISTLKNQKEIQISILNIQNQEGTVQQAAAPFDPVLGENGTHVIRNVVQHNLPGFVQPDPSHYKLNDTVASASLNKLTRIGTSYSLFAQYEYFSSKPISTHGSQVSFSIDQPLLRNFLYGLNRQREEASFLELEAVNWDTLQTISSRILRTITSYWEVVAATQSQEVIQKATERIEKLVELTEKLIKGEQLAAEDVNQSQAVLVVQKRNLSQTQASLFLGQQQLLFSMGFFDEEALSLDKTIEVDKSLPPVFLDDQRLDKLKDYYIRLSFEKRFDVLASQIREEESLALVIGAENQVLPQLDIVGSVTANDLHPIFETDYIPPGELLNQELVANKKNYSLNYTIGLSFSIPFNNDGAEGYLKQVQARKSQAVMQTQLIKQNLITMILQTINNQISLRKQLDQAQEAINKYDRLVQNETIKLQEGFSTVFVLLNFESSLIDAQLQWVTLYKQYIQGIANLRYLTGTLIEPAPKNHLCLMNTVDALTYPFPE